MDMLKMTIDDNEYEYIDSIVYEGKNYVALGDTDCITICEYVLEDGKVKLIPLDDTLFLEVKEVMQL